ncbi:MAG: hypothetical protein PHF56_12650 [Desulfuromonadaceae bacterium]|nr:hypothetical protein [Desulfuromonadaceae bacterium]
MKTRIITTVAVAGLLAALATSDVFAAGRGNGGSRGQSTSTQAAAGTTATRPAGSQRRDGTFLTTGVTANGSTTRQGKGSGLMDGSCLTTTPSVPAATTAP